MPIAGCPQPVVMGWMDALPGGHMAPTEVICIQVEGLRAGWRDCCLGDASTTLRPAPAVSYTAILWALVYSEQPFKPQTASELPPLQYLGPTGLRRSPLPASPPSGWHYPWTL